MEEGRGSKGMSCSDQHIPVDLLIIWKEKVSPAKFAASLIDWYLASKFFGHHPYNIPGTIMYGSFWSFQLYEETAWKSVILTSTSPPSSSLGWLIEAILVKILYKSRRWSGVVTNLSIHLTLDCNGECLMVVWDDRAGIQGGVDWLPWYLYQKGF